MKAIWSDEGKLARWLEVELAALEGWAAVGVVPGDALAETARALALRLAAGPTATIGLTKRLLSLAENSTLAESLAAEAALQEVAGRTEDHAEGVAAFSEKRDPRFGGR